MTSNPATLRLLGCMAAGSGFLLARATDLWRAARSRLAPEAGWRRVEAAGLQWRAPADWGEPESDGRGGVTVHNRPRRFRVDGDAVWYSSAIELRITAGDGFPARGAEAMTTTRRVIRRPAGPLTIELAVANGAGPRRRAQAARVLRSVEPVRERQPGRREVGVSARRAAESQEES